MVLGRCKHISPGAGGWDLKKKDDDVASYRIAKGLCKALFLRKSDLESDFSKE